MEFLPPIHFLHFVALLFFGPALLIVVLFGPLAPFDYKRLVLSWFKSPANTFLLFLTTVGIVLLAGGVIALHIFVPYFKFVSPLFLLYLGVVYARILSLYYFTNRWRLNWLKVK